MPCFAQPPRASDAMLPQPWNLNGGFVRRVSAHEFPTVTIEGPESVLGSSSLHAAGQSNERAPKAIRSSKKGFEPYHARAVPKSADLKSAARDASTEQVLVTTIMLRNIPNKYSQSTMLEEIDDEGFPREPGEASAAGRFDRRGTQEVLGKGCLECPRRLARLIVGQASMPTSAREGSCVES